MYPGKVLVLYAQGMEEMEAIITVDVLRRAGLTVVTASLDPRHCVRSVDELGDPGLSSKASQGGGSYLTASRNTYHLADRDLDSVLNTDLGVLSELSVSSDPRVSFEPSERLDYDLIVLPGGLGGTQKLDQDPRIPGLLRKFQSQGKWIAAICAGPSVLLNHGILTTDQNYTAYPGSTPQNGNYTGSPLEVTRNRIVTSRGPGTAFIFALQLVEILSGKEKRDKVEAALQF